MNLKKFVLTQLDPEASLKVPTFTISLYGSSCNSHFWGNSFSLLFKFEMNGKSRIAYQKNNCCSLSRLVLTREPITKSNNHKEDSEISQLSQQNLQWIRQIQYSCKQLLGSIVFTVDCSLPIRVSYFRFKIVLALRRKFAKQTLVGYFFAL